MAKKIPVASPQGPFHNPFTALGDQLGPLPPGPSVEPRRAQDARVPKRAVVRLERKGHGGKEVTIIERLELDEPELLSWLGSLKGALGCGGTMAMGTIVLQGDQRLRVTNWLAARGVLKISKSQ